MKSDIHRIMEYGEDALQASRKYFNLSFHQVFLTIEFLDILA